MMQAQLRQSIDGDQLREQRLELFQRHHVGAVRRRAVGILMGLDEDAGDADRHGRARQHRHEAPLAAARRPLPSRLLHRMGRVEDHRRARLGEDRQRAHVGDERVVAERHAALGDQDVRVARADDLGDHVLHVPGREELPLLDVDRLAGRGRREQKIGLAAEEGRDLQDVDGFGDGRALLRLMHVGDHGKAERLADLGKDRQRLLETQPARRFAALVRFALSKEHL